MARLVRDIVEVSDYIALEALIEQLQIIRASLSDWASPQVELRGDDFFGKRLTITYLREQTREEVALDERYSAGVCGVRTTRSARSPRKVSPVREARLRRTQG